jgi:hypothetical protein
MVELHAISIADGPEAEDALYTSPASPYVRSMTANDVRSNEPVRHGAYLCLSALHRTRRLADLRSLLSRLELRNEYEPGDDHPPLAIAFLRRRAPPAAAPQRAAAPVDELDEALARTEAIVHVAAPDAAIVTTLCAELTRLLAPAPPPRILAGVVRPPSYTGNLMHNFAYAHRVLQQPASRAPHAFLMPMRKTAAWWAKDWMERHTYFLPRYEHGHLRSQGHALAAAPGVACLMRRTYKHPVEPAPADAYDFLNYFECADADVPTFDAVCAALRDVTNNPEWAFVHEGPTWHGRRVATWDEMLD